MKISINVAMLFAMLTTAFFVNAQNIKDIEKCAQTENDLERLICYDELFKVSANGSLSISNQAAVAIEQDASKEANVTVKPPPVIELTRPSISAAAVAVSPQKMDSNEATERLKEPAVDEKSAVDRFGAEDLGRKEDKEELSKIESVIDALTENNRSIRTFTLANGQVWQETENSRLRLKVGMPIYIEKGAFSAHFLGKQSSNRRVRVKRVK